jgi:hypothetical protein
MQLIIDPNFCTGIFPHRPIDEATDGEHPELKRRSVHGLNLTVVVIGVLVD